MNSVQEFVPLEVGLTTIWNGCDGGCTARAPGIRYFSATANT